MCTGHTEHIAGRGLRTLRVGLDVTFLIIMISGRVIPLNYFLRLGCGEVSTWAQAKVFWCFFLLYPHSDRFTPAIPKGSYFITANSHPSQQSQQCLPECANTTCKTAQVIVLAPCFLSFKLEVQDSEEYKPILYPEGAR
jgi:hypothetical protein